mmetsp:Transcript_82277/g.241544  ORF Transcript_82277/g.241544 Transcript_82277/m.241544 type:complete len:557 (-) Transcript_82277:427-2097(-)
MARYQELPDPDEPQRERPRSRITAQVCKLASALCLLACAALVWRRPGQEEAPALRGGSSLEAIAEQAQRRVAEVPLSEGRAVVGALSVHGRSFYGVPFGRAGRWEEPQPRLWEGVWDATSSSAVCMQPGGEAYGGMTEDCLQLSIFAPPQVPLAGGAAQLPVLVWFFGGAFLGGGSFELTAKSVSHLVAGLSVVIVVPNTRVGVFGYLGSDALRRNSTGNWGTLDQKLALQWVSDHIHHFGGDPKRVTIGGWSSGAASASLFLTMPSSKQLFHGALMMSGGFADWAAFSLTSAEATYRSLLQATGCESSVDCLAEGPPCRCLLDLPAQALNAAQGTPQMLSWAPVVDHVVVHSTPWAALGSGSIRQVPIMIGSTLEDSFPVLSTAATDTDFARWLKTTVPLELVSRAYSLYMDPNDELLTDDVHAGITQAYWEARRANADRGQACVARRVARRWPMGAWQYFWKTRFRGESTAGFGPGISHSSDQHFLFQERLPQAWVPAARALQRAVAAFLHHHRPEQPWPSGGGEGLVFEQAGPVVSSIRPEQCSFWDEALAEE